MRLKNFISLLVAAALYLPAPVSAGGYYEKIVTNQLYVRDPNTHVLTQITTNGGSGVGTTNGVTDQWLGNARFDVYNVVNYGAVCDGTTDNGPAFQKAINAAVSYPAAWQATHAYAVGDYVTNGGTVRSYVAITAGTSAGSGGPTSTSSNITDGTVHWKYLYNGNYSFNMGAEVFVPPCADGSKSYKIATPIVVFTTQTGQLSGGPLTFRFHGSGAASPIKIAVGGSNKAFSFTFNGQEWQRSFFDDLAFVTGDNAHAVPDCYNVLYIDGKVGWSHLRNIHMIGVQSATDGTGKGLTSLIVLSEGNFTLDGYHDAGGFAGADCQSYAVMLDQVAIAKVSSVWSYSEYLFNGFDSGTAGGCSYSLVNVNPSRNTTARSVVSIDGINSFTARNTYVVSSLPTTGSTNTASLEVRHFSSLLGAGLVQVLGADNVVIADGVTSSSTVRPLLDAHSVTNFRIERAQKILNADVYPKIVTDGGSGEIVDTPLGVVAGSPCGVVPPEATDSIIYVTTNGIRARVRRAKSVATPIAQYTHVKADPGADYGVDQLATTDDPRLSIGIALDAAESNTASFIRVVEGFGQMVTMKSDGAGALAPGDIVTTSAASAGRIKKTTTGGANIVGTVMTTVAASADAVAQVLYYKSQY